MELSYIITKVFNDVNFVVCHTNTGKSQIVHYDRMKSYHSTISSVKFNKTVEPRRKTSTLKQTTVPKQTTSHDDGLLELDITPECSQVSQNNRRPRREAAVAARVPGFYSLH